MRNGSRVAGGVPRNVYRADDDRWLVVSATTDAQAGRVLGLLGRDTDEDRERFGSSAARIAHADELDTLVEEWIAARSRGEALEAFAEQRNVSPKFREASSQHEIFRETCFAGEMFRRKRFATALT